MRLTHHRKAFTLIELLVVIGVIAILIAILMPALQRARRQAQAVACGSYMKQIFLGFRMYADDNKGWLPPATGYYRRPSNPASVDFPNWNRHLTKYDVEGEWQAPVDYVRNRKIYVCPSSPPKVGGNSETFRGSYGFNDRMSTETPPPGANLRYAKVFGALPNGYAQYHLNSTLAPTKMYLLGDAVWDAINLRYNPPSLEFPALRHSSKANILFHDGHIELLAKGDLAGVSTGSVGAYYLPFYNKRIYKP